MVVGVQKGLEHVKEFLRNQGFEVVTYGERRFDIDILIYSGYVLNRRFTMKVKPEVYKKKILLNIDMKSADEIAKVLKYMVYSEGVI